MLDIYEYVHPVDFVREEQCTQMIIKCMKYLFLKRLNWIFNDTKETIQVVLEMLSVELKNWYINASYQNHNFTYFTFDLLSVYIIKGAILFLCEYCD